MEFNKPLDLEALAVKRGLAKTKAGDLLGVTYQSWRKYVSGETKIPDPINKLIHFIFWKELDIPQSEILEELRLNESGNNVDNEECKKQIEEYKNRERVLMATIDNLHQQLEKMN